MHDTNLPSKGLELKKLCLIAGMMILLISVGIIFPIESSKTYLITELPYTYLTLAISLFLMMFGLMGKHFFKGLLLLFSSALLGFASIYAFYFKDPWNALSAAWLGIPSGIISALIFLVINFFFLKDKNNDKRLKQVITYVIILVTVCILFVYGGDWLFKLTQYMERESKH